MEKGGSGHPRRQLPLLPSGPGGVRQLCVAQSRISCSTQRAAEREGFEPSVAFATHDFQSCSFGHSDISPTTNKGSAEREGFEPPVPLRVHLISNQAQSTRLCHLSIRSFGARKKTPSGA